MGKDPLMPLPTGPIPLVAVGEIIEEDWGDSVAQSLNNLTEQHDFLTWKPASGVTYDATGTVGGSVAWFTVGGGTPEQLYVPTWATTAYVQYQVCGIQYQPVDSTPRISYLLNAHLGSLTGRGVRFTGQGGWFGMSWADEFTAVEDIAGGDRSIKIYAQKIEGDSGEVWRLTDQSDVAISVVFKQAIHTYPGL
jgi:hypothetical protein